METEDIRSSACTLIGNYITFTLNTKWRSKMAKHTFTMGCKETIEAYNFLASNAMVSLKKL
jgi:hypothetical protein